MAYFRQNIVRTIGYTPGEQPKSTDKILKLNTNENPYPPSPKAIEAIQQASSRLNRYPDPLANSFRKAASEVLGVPYDWFLACNGSDDALTILTRATLDTDDLMVSPVPSYPLYRILADIQGCRFQLRPFAADGSLPADFTKGAKLSFVPNPNSPTGTFISPDKFTNCLTDGIMVIDEAYTEFAPANCINLVRKDERFIISRTFSKSHSLAGLRFGYIIAQPEIIQQLRKVKDSYNCDSLSIAGATAAILDVEYHREINQKVMATRQRTEDALQKLGFQVTPSNGNFVWIRSENSFAPIYMGLKERGVLVRYMNFGEYGEGVRISIGTDPEMDQFFRDLDNVLAELGKTA